MLGKRRQIFLSTLSLRRATGKDLYRYELIWVFLSTLSLRRATRKCLVNARANPDFYPRSPCGERRKTNAENTRISIFLSTLSLRRATVYAWHGHQRRAISIHALLAESDLVKKEDFDKVMSISIHALLAESDAGFTFCARGAGQFLSTLSLRRATLTLCVAS